MTGPNDIPDVNDTPEVRRYLMTQAHEAELWRTQWDAKMNGMHPKACRTEMLGHVRYIKYGLYILAFGVLTLFSAIFVLK